MAVDPKRTVKKRGRWTIKDIFFGVFGLTAIVAVTLAAFIAAKWALHRWAQYLPWMD